MSIMTIGIDLAKNVFDVHGAQIKGPDRDKLHPASTVTMKCRSA